MGTTAGFIAWAVAAGNGMPEPVAPYIGLGVGLLVGVLYSAYISRSMADMGGYEDYGRSVYLWEYRPGVYKEASIATSGGAGQNVTLSDPSGSYSDAYDQHGNLVARLRRVGPDEWVAL